MGSLACCRVQTRMDGTSARKRHTSHAVTVAGDATHSCYSLQIVCFKSSHHQPLGPPPTSQDYVAHNFMACTLRGALSLAARSATWRPDRSLLRAAQPVVASFSRGLAKKPAKGKKGEDVAAPIATAGNPEDVVRGLNIFKDQTAEIEVKPDSEYPDWVFTLHMPRATFDELATRYKEDKSSLSEQDTKRMIKLWNRSRIRESNEEKKK